MSPDMATRLGPAELPNPVLSASGCAGFGRELAAFFDLGRLGALVTPSVTVGARAGRPTPRLVETPGGLLNAVGLPGDGLESVLREELPWLAAHGARVVVSVAGHSVADYAEVARRVAAEAGAGSGAGAVLSALEVNLSSPNVEDRGVVFAARPGASAELVRAVRVHTSAELPVFAKLSPDVTDIVSIALACVDAGADGLTLVNTPAGMAIDTDTFRPALAGTSGGLSGPAIRPIAVRCVYQVHAALPTVPIIGVGGVWTGLDALELILAGASAVQVGTAVLNDPSACPRVLRELEEALARRGIARVADAVGLAHQSAAVLPRQIRPEHASAVVPPPGARPLLAEEEFKESTP